MCVKKLIYQVIVGQRLSLPMIKTSLKIRKILKSLI